ncbi:uncharacterized protein [Musca autumnalis]|uniref:uncharacterized protein n=1 Tax=Musca autumnalis TaxID=221902 RepID=UPI003CE75572
MPVHFLFLFSLGLFSWAILCYFKQVEKYLMDSSDNIEVSSIAFQPRIGRPNDITYSPSSSYHDQELYVNFFCLLACVYVLARVANIAQGYLASEMYKKLNIQKTFEQFTQLDRKSNDDLIQQIHKLEEQNFELRLELRDVHRDGPGQGNIYISNKFFHLNNSKNSHNTKVEDGNDVWVKYLEMQKCCKFHNDHNNAFVPVVLAPQDLKKTWID